jgi:hypothetical protein
MPMMPPPAINPFGALDRTKWQELDPNFRHAHGNPVGIYIVRAVEVHRVVSLCGIDPAPVD